ncbi:metallophosphoesterase [Methyloceanibacter stevinii]|uniref:Metallophosphoesterase n=1 Tax=Methyloceanibacter stevinii TaxID=1774970 RepID=A0A1E3VR27_9HYPH|nr:metallophosphoesterase [Methyloceanibacter stevinii]ODR95972.1 metallophosphoesterase [Methyloceanibacter stevinii]
MSEDRILKQLEQRLGRRHARQRLGVENDHEAQVFGQGINFFHIENLPIGHTIIRAVLMASGLYWRGRRNAAKVVLKDNVIATPHVPKAFDGFTMLQISDLHVEYSADAMTEVMRLVEDLPYDVCLLTGDYRAKTWGTHDAAVDGMRRVCSALKGPVYGVLGNHDSVRMLPALEDMGIRMLMNEAETIRRGEDRIHIVGIDDAHFYRADNIEKAAEGIPHEDFSVLVTHTPEIYRQAAHADFDVLVSGHTHGGQFCLPGGIPLTLSAVLPRALGSGAWRHHSMVGYTAAGAGSSVVPVRFNCPPEITLHRLQLSDQ